jgi:hypothetical protein
MQWLGWLFILLGAVLRLRQYAANRSLWVDEASLALNIVNRTYMGLTQPLDYDQGAPLGFLFVVKLTTDVLGNHDFILRFIPLLSGILSLVLVYRITIEHFGKPALAALLMFSVSGAMIAYSTELKQYSTDVLIALLLIHLTLRTLRDGVQGRNIILLGLTGIAAVLMSHSSVFTIPFVGLILAGIAIFKKDRPLIYRLIGMGSAWVGMLLIIYWISLRNLVGNENLQEYWKDRFAPVPPWEHLDWYRNVFVALMPNVTPSFFPYLVQNFDSQYLMNICLALILLGGGSLLFRNMAAAILFGAPIGLMFFASALRLYPVSERFLYFWFPSLLFLLAEGMWLIYSSIARYNQKAAWIVYGSAMVIVFWTSFELAFQNILAPPMGEDIKPVLAYVRDHMQEDDDIYVHQGSTTPFLYYSPVYGLNTENTFVAKKSWNMKRFMVDLNDFQDSERIWFIFSHVISCDCDGRSNMDRIRHYVGIIDSYGVQLDHFTSSNAGTYLYDLNP